MASSSGRGGLGRGILGGPVDMRRGGSPTYPVVDARPKLLVTHRASGFTGAVRAITHDRVNLRSATGLDRGFPLEPGAFRVDGATCTLRRPAPAPDQRSAAARTASGSRAVAGAKARVARAARIVVEGVHDAELVEKVWGDDLRLEGVVVERLDGLDRLPEFVREFQPGPTRRLGVLADHLVAGSKEARIAASVASPFILVTGTPYVDVWAAVRPSVVGIERWPEIPKGQPWKEGICAALGVADPRAFWRQILGSVRSYGDLTVEVVGAVESLIDFVTTTGAGQA